MLNALLTFSFHFLIVKSRKEMLSTLTVDLIDKGFLKNTDEVHFAKKMRDLLLISLKILKHFLNNALLADEVISEHIMKMPPLVASMFNL